MKRVCKGLTVIALIFLMTPPAEAQFSGRDLADEWKAYQRATSKTSGMRTDQVQAADYMGFLQGVWYAAGYYSLKAHAVGAGVTVNQTCHVVGRYLDAHPERWHEPAVILVVDALNEAFPEFPTKKK